MGRTEGREEGRVEPAAQQSVSTNQAAVRQTDKLAYGNRRREDGQKEGKKEKMKNDGKKVRRK